MTVPLTEAKSPYSVSVCQLSVQPLVLLPQLADGLCVPLDGGLRALIVCTSVALWWTFLVITPTITEKASHYSLIIQLSAFPVGCSYGLAVASQVITKTWQLASGS